MQVVLLERVEKLGAIGDVVAVKPGFARNFLLPQGKALRATAANMERFEREREVLVKLNEERAAKARESGSHRRRQLRADPSGVRERPALRLGVHP